MAWILAAAAVICAVVLLRRWNSAPRKTFETVAPPVVPGAAAVPAGEGAVTAAEMEDMNRAARERRRSALIARWWNC